MSFVSLPKRGGNTCSISMFIPRLANIMRTGYVMDDLNQLFDRAGNNVHTINLRILWGDTIITRDHRVVQHILANGFADFEKGPKLRLLYVRPF